MINKSRRAARTCFIASLTLSSTISVGFADPNASRPVPETFSLSTSNPPLQPFTFDFATLSGSTRNIDATGTVERPLSFKYGGELDVDANHVTADLGLRKFTAEGDIRVRELDTFLSADSVQVWEQKRTAEASNARFYQRPFDLSARTIDLQSYPSSEPNSRDNGVLAHDVRLTTARPGVTPDFEIVARIIGIYPNRRSLIIKRGSVYLFRHKIAFLPYASFPLGSSSGGQNHGYLHPAVGSSTREGLFVAVDGRRISPDLRYGLLLPSRHSVEGYLEARQTLLIHRPSESFPRPMGRTNIALYGLRQLASATAGPIPYGDPLRYHDFIADTDPIQLFELPRVSRLFVAEGLSYHVNASGGRHDDLQVTRIPEIQLNGVLPLTPPKRLVQWVDAEGFRRDLARVKLYTTAQVGVGSFREDPGNRRDTRQRGVVTLGTEPLLVANNVVIVPSVSAVANHYERSRQTYSYIQSSIALRRYFSDRSAIAVQYIESYASGASPFNFDTLDTTREFDVRTQVGDHKFAFGELLRYDAIRHNFIDYKLSAAFGMHGVTPTLAYNFRTRRLGVGLEIEGITF